MHVNRVKEREEQLEKALRNAMQETPMKTKRHLQNSMLLFTKSDMESNMAIVANKGLFKVPRSKILHTKAYFSRKKERGWADSQKFLGSHYKNVSIPDDFLKPFYLEDKQTAGLSKAHGNCLAIIYEENNIKLYSAFPHERIQEITINLDKAENLLATDHRLHKAGIKPLQLLSRQTANGAELLYRDHYTIYSRYANQNGYVKFCSTTDEMYDMLVSPFFSEEIAILTRNNKVITVEEISSVISLDNSTACKDQVMYFDYGPHPKSFITGTLHAVKLFDSRSKSKCKPLYEPVHWTDTIYSLKYLDEFHYALTSAEHLCIYDIRWNGKRLQRTLHCCPENPPNHLVVPTTALSFMNSYKCSASAVSTSPIGSLLPISSDVLLGYNDAAPSCALLMSHSRCKTPYEDLALHKDNGAMLIERCQAAIFRESYDSCSPLDCSIAATLVYTPSLLTEYSKVRGAQLVPLRSKLLTFAVDNIGTITLEAFKKTEEGIMRVNNKERINVEDIMDTWKAQYLWKHQRSQSEEDISEEIIINEIKKPLFKELDLKKTTEKILKKALVYKESKMSAMTIIDSSIPEDHETESTTSIKKYNKRGFITKDFVNYLKHTWNQS